MVQIANGQSKQTADMAYGVVKNPENLPTLFMDGPLLAYRPFRFVSSDDDDDSDV